MRLTTARKPFLLLVGIAALAALAVVLWQTTRSEAQENQIHVMPRMALTYETNGPAIGVGDRDVGGFREIRRLDYTSRTNWTDTVIESPTVDLGRYGTASNVGSYESVNGKAAVSYDAMTDSLDEYTRDSSAFSVPNVAFVYAAIPPDTLDAAGSGYTKSVVASNVSVCKDGSCQENVSAVRYRKPNTSFDLVMYKTDQWFIPLKNGTLYEARRIDVLE